MQQSRKLAVLAVSVALGGLIGAPMATAGDEDFSHNGRFTDFDREDNGERGWSEGDKVDFAFDLFDGRRRAGDGEGTCVITKLNREERDFAADCEGTMDLDDGGLNLKGDVTDEEFRDGAVVVDVVGGNGAYDGAGGTATFTSARGGKGKGKGGHRRGDGDADASSSGIAVPSGLLGGDKDGDDGAKDSDDGAEDSKDGKDRRGRGGHGRGHGGGRHFKVDVDLN